MNNKNCKVPVNKAYLAVSILGSALKLNINYSNINHIELNRKETEIILNLPKIYKNKNNTEIINLSIKKMYSQIAETEIANAMETSRHILHFAPEDYRLERLEGLFYKCTKNKILIVNPDIVQYNKDIIVITLLQAFCKIKYKTNSANYKKMLQYSVEKYSESKKNNLFRLLKVS